MNPTLHLIRKLLPAVGLLTLLACSGGEETAGPGTPAAQATPPPIEAIETEGLLQKIGTLSSDEFGGREPLSEGERLTLSFLEDEFRGLGLEPMFGDSYLQPVPLVSIEALNAPGLNIHSEDGSIRLAYKYGPEAMVWTMRVNEKVSVESSELVWAGYGIVAPEYGWNDYEGLDVSGKTVVVLVNDPGFATQDPEIFNGNAMTYYGRWTYKYEEAARQGASAMLIVHQETPAGYGWNVVEDSWSGPQYHLAPDDGNQGRIAVEGWVQYEVGKEILAAAGQSLDDLAAQAAQGSTPPLPLGLQLDTHLDNSLTFAESYNVGAIRRGSVAPDELFIYMAHWDHLGTSDHEPGEAGDFIYNGAEDNASGTSGMLEIAEAWAARPEPAARSVGFLAVTAEESGLLGSKAYAEQPAFPMNKTAGGINMDRLNVRGKVQDVVVIGHGASEMEDVLAAVAADHGRTVTPEATPEKGYYYRSDHFNFAKKGVPILYARGGTVDREHGGEYITQRNAQYVAERYHSPADEIQDDWDVDAAVEDLRLFYRIGEKVADSDMWPQWYPGNEFRAIREKSLPGTGD